MKASDLFVASLEAAGVQYVFGVPGEENLAFIESIRTSSIKLITTRHEQTAVFMAATVGRLTGRVGVALSTLGPGATNLVTGVAYAQLGGMPLMVITGQKPIKKSKQGKFQIIDVVGMMKPITKFAETIVSADRIPTTVHQAINKAETERPGATHIEFPEDIAEEQSDALPIQWSKVRRPIPDTKSIENAVTAISVAKLPVIAIAAGSNRKLIRKQLQILIEKTGIPFVTTQMGKGVVDENHPLYLGTTALSSGDFMHSALDQSDCIIMLGHDITEKPPLIGRDDQTIIHVNFYPADFDDVYMPQLQVIGDISNALWEMSERLQKQDHWDFSGLLNLRQRLLTDIAEKTEDSSFPIKPQRFVHDLRKVMPKDGILSLDNGMYKLWIARNYIAYEQNTVLLDNALATMGAGLGAGMAAKMLNPDKKVVVVAGDGGFMMSMSDLETAKRLGRDLVIVIVNDNGYGMIKWKQNGMDLPNFGLEFTNPDFVKLADSYGIKGTHVDSAEGFAIALQEALDEGGLQIIEIPIDYSENSTYFGDNLKNRSC